MKVANHKLIFLIFITFFTIYWIVFFTIKDNQKTQIDRILANKIKILETYFHLEVDYQSTNAKSAYNALSNNKKFIKLLAKVQTASQKEQALLRKELKRILSPMVRRMKDREVFGFHIVLPDNTSFLKMHLPDIFGEDISYRYIIEYVNKFKKPISGFETCNYMNGFRYAYPLFDKNGIYIGAMELSFNSKLIQKRLTKFSGIHTHFIINKESSKKNKSFIENDYSIQNNKFLFYSNYEIDSGEIIKPEKHIIKVLKSDIIKNIKTGKPFSLYLEKDHTVHTLSFFPIKDIRSNNTQAYLISYAKSDELYALLTTTFIIQLLLFFILALLGYFIYRIYAEKRSLQHKVQLKTKELTDINNNLEHIVKEKINENNKQAELLSKQAKLAALGEMMDAIAHQWKQPLSIISAVVQNLDLQIQYKGIATIDEIEYANNLTLKQIDHLITTIDEFRSFFRPNQKLLKINIRELIEDTLSLMESQIIKENISIEINCDQNVEIFCIPNELKHVFINLINNSKDAFKSKNIENRTISIDVLTQNDKLVIKVKDNGGGIPEDIIGNIFQSNFTTKERVEGTGIGLYLNKQIIDKLHGTIDAKNITNGVSFIIKLPINSE